MGFHAMFPSEPLKLLLDNRLLAENHGDLETVARKPGMRIPPRRGRTDQPRATPWDAKSDRPEP